MNKDFEKIVLTEEDIKKAVNKVAEEINHDYKGKKIVMIGMLKGVLPFMMDLIKLIDVPLQMDFMQICTYHGGTAASKLEFIKDITIDIKDRDVIILDDIIDSGITLNEVLKTLKNRGASSIEICCLLDKPHHRKVDLKPKYIGTTIEDGFMVGYGLDYDEYYRNVPYIGILSPKIYNK